METKKPLNILCSEAIIKYMDFSVRSAVTRKSPGFCELQKFTPARIQRLSLDQKRIEIDDGIYRLSVVQTCNDGEPSQYVKEMNKKGGWENDLDEYGLEKEMPGCSVITVQSLVNELARARGRLGANFKKYPSSAEAFRRQFQKENRTICYKLKTLKLKSRNLPSAYNQYIRLAVITKTFKTVEYVKYSHRLQEAMEYLMTKIFGSSTLNDKKIIIRNMTVEENAGAYLETLSPKINYENHPLNTITTVGGNYSDFAITGSADLHIIQEEDVKYCSNALRVHFKIEWLNVNQFYGLLEYLKKASCPIGKHISINNGGRRFITLSSIPNVVRGTFPGDENPIQCYTARHGSPDREINCFFVRNANATELHIKINPRGFAAEH
ncbi:hypothetical protein GCK72_023013 [Caenorhabditis remanei]|uniref:Uncharacterized protein n=1 Tax=Caenorhabditis remanei TaxID=31234 RepID=A0A6A5FVJ7_CAERE|nr:hypothetical protein GCK72_023013 [Caenorhabditis remanei]KAF1746556.1 hypothetical protein GCK72_023013 [Caenorhabditis remanei]